jgi:hypothetical protein
MVKLNKKINNDNKKRMKRVLVFLNVRHARARSYNGSDYFLRTCFRQPCGSVGGKSIVYEISIAHVAICQSES